MVVVSPDIVVGEVVSTMGRFVDFGVEEQEHAALVRHSGCISSTNFLSLNVCLESRSQRQQIKQQIINNSTTAPGTGGQVDGNLVI